MINKFIKNKIKKENIKDTLPIFSTCKLESFWRIKIQMKRLHQKAKIKNTPEFEKVIWERN